MNEGERQEIGFENAQWPENAPFPFSNLITLWNDKSNYSRICVWLDQNRLFSGGFKQTCSLVLNIFPKKISKSCEGVAREIQDTNMITKTKGGP